MSGKCQDKWTSVHQNNFTALLLASVDWFGVTTMFVFCCALFFKYHFVQHNLVIFPHHSSPSITTLSFHVTFLMNLGVTSVMPRSLLIKSQRSHFRVWSLICSQVYINLLLKNTLHFIQQTLALTRIWTDSDKRQCVCAGCECIADYLRYFPKALVWH